MVKGPKGRRRQQQKEKEFERKWKTTTTITNIEIGKGIFTEGKKKTESNLAVHHKRRGKKRFLQFLLPFNLSFPFLFSSLPSLLLTLFSPHKETDPKTEIHPILNFPNYPVLPDQPIHIPPFLARLLLLSLSRALSLSLSLHLSLFLSGTGTI